MKSLFIRAVELLEKKEDLVLVTVIASSGATPRGAGARMIVSNSGREIGTIGGGAVEYRSEHMAAEVLKGRSSFEHSFNLTKSDVENLGMICGGAVTVFFSFIGGDDDEQLKLFKKALEYMEKGSRLWLVSDIKNGGKLGLYTREDGFFGIRPEVELEDCFTGGAKRIKSEDTDYYVENINRSEKVFVFGCGHVGQELVRVLAHIGFSCIALDDRPKFARRELFPTAEDVRLIDFENIYDSIEINEGDYVCVMTRGHAFDAIVQAQVLKSPAYYIGVIGSAHKKKGVFQKLSEEYGYTEKDFARITSPIGLPILAETPAEIAISIAAQLIEERAKQGGE